MYGSNYIFGRSFFEAWVIVSIIWVWVTMLITGFYPLVDGWGAINRVFVGLRESKASQK